MEERKLVKTILDKTSVSNIIYAEIAGGGAMGCAGQVMLYIIEEKQLICYKTSLFDDEETYIQMEALLYKLSGLYTLDDFLTDFDDLDIANENFKIYRENLKNILFNHYEGGFGNNVFINKNVSLNVVEEHFVYKINNEEYCIFSSVPGVFYHIASELKRNAKKSI